jgi:hypothetical protein
LTTFCNLLICWFIQFVLWTEKHSNFIITLSFISITLECYELSLVPLLCAPWLLKQHCLLTELVLAWHTYALSIVVCDWKFEDFHWQMCCWSTVSEHYGRWQEMPWAKMKCLNSTEAASTMDTVKFTMLRLPWQCILCVYVLKSLLWLVRKFVFMALKV